MNPFAIWGNSDVSIRRQPKIRETRTTLAIILRVFLFLFVTLALPVLAFSHATPIQYLPAGSSVLSQAPAEVQIHFSERVEPRVSSIAVLGPDGSRVDLQISESIPPIPESTAWA